MRKKAALSSAQKNTKYGVTAAADSGVHEAIPYTRHIDDYTIQTQDGDLIQFIKLSGLPFETMDQAELDMRKNVRALLLKNIGSPDVALYYHIIRREVDATQSTQFQNEWCQRLHDAYNAKLKQKRMFINEQYISVIYRPDSGITGKVKSFIGKLDAKSAEIRDEENLDFLTKRTNTLLGKLQKYGSSKLSVYENDKGLFSEPLSFLYYLVNFEHRDVHLPFMNLKQYLPAKRIFFGKEAIEIRGMQHEDVRNAAVLSIKDYNAATGAGMFDELLRLNREYVVTESFEFLSREPILQKMYRIQRQLESTDSGASTMESEVAEGIDNAASGLSVYGNHHMTVTAFENNASELSVALTEIDTVFAETGNIVVREDMNMEAAFWAQLPGNFRYIARKCPITNYNFASFASLHNFPTGKPHRNHWGDAICLLETTSNTPYHFNFHVGEVGNFTLIGPTGAGKTVLLSFLTAQAMKHNPKIIYFDKDRGAEIFIRTVEGDYTVINSGMPTGLNPLQLEDSPTNRAFLKDWIICLIQSGDNSVITHDEDNLISEAIQQNYSIEPEYRTLTQLSATLGGHTSNGPSLSARLQRWYGTGDMAWLFDNDEDTLSLGNNVIGFDLTSILDDQTSRTPWLMYIFHRINEMMTGQKVIIMLDEGWKLVDDPTFAQKIKDWHKTIRKQNGLIGFATQSPGDALNSPIADSIIEQSHTQIFLANPKATKERYCEGFKLSEQEFDFIKNTAPEDRCFLVKHNHDSVIAKLDLSDMDEYISILSGTANSVNLLDTIRAEHGDNVKDWYQPFLQHLKGATI